MRLLTHASMIQPHRNANFVLLVPRESGVHLQYDAKLCNLLEVYDKAFLVHADNVGSRQFMDIRKV